MLSDHQVEQSHHHAISSTRWITGTESLLDDVRPFHFGLTSFRFPHNAMCNMSAAHHAFVLCIFEYRHISAHGTIYSFM